MVVDNGLRKLPRGTLGTTAVCLSQERERPRATSDVNIQGSLLLKPESAGFIELRSASIFDHPAIDAKYIVVFSSYHPG